LRQPDAVEHPQRCRYIASHPAEELRRHALVADRAALTHDSRVSDDRATDSILEAALRLPELGRVRVAAELLASVDGPDELTDARWLDELRRRADRVRRGEAQGRPWSEVRAELLADLAR
jgi:hypothetical protein